MKVSIALTGGQWVYDTDDLLGPPGGFGEVFRGYGEDGRTVAIKRLKISVAEAAHRELRMADVLRNLDLKHVLPFLDAGQDTETDFYYVVMPIAEKSLSAHISKTGPLGEQAVVSILRDVAAGLAEVNKIVHRDLKPDNVLLHDAKWKLADFGIARFVEESTSLRTLKACLSPPYAAPEQWNYVESTSSTDIYALGCIGYALLTGRPPFFGPGVEEYRQQHLHDSPPNNLNCSGQLRSLLSMMLRKSPDARPSRDRVIEILEQLNRNQSVQPAGGGLKSLSEAGAAVAAEAAVAEATAARTADERARRQALAREAENLFKRLRDEFFASVVEVAPAATREDEARLRLGGAVLQMKLIGLSGGYSTNRFSRSGWDVILGGTVAVRQDRPTYVWSSSLWYTKLFPEDEFRWREVSYFGSPFLKERPRYEPFALEDELQADEAASRIMGKWQIAFGPVCIDDEHSSDFKERWSELYAKAVQGQLGHPSRLPLISKKRSG